MMIENDGEEHQQEQHHTKYCSKHSNIDAPSYCKMCKKYMCAECRGFHDGFFGQEHDDSIIPSESVKDSCLHSDKCSVHPEYPLDTICNNCNCTYLIFQASLNIFIFVF